MRARTPCSGMGCYPDRCSPGECVRRDADEHFAAEGAQPPTTTGAGLTPAQWAALADAQRDPWLPLAMAVGAVLAFAASALYPWGFA